jgi:glyoxylase-like metal-dependent hydrolase (beta-lactamase superfamily II)
LVIEQANGIVVSEAPLYPERSEAIIDWAKGQFPDKPITHVISSHHHRDHSSGLRSFVAQDVPVVMSEQAVDVFREVFSRPSTIVPDDLAGNPATPIFELVPLGGMFEIPDPERPVTAFALDSSHASDTLFTYVGGGEVIFMGDGGQQTPELQAALEDKEISVSWYAGGHGEATAVE